MSPVKKAQPVSPGVARRKPVGAKPEAGLAQRELALLMVGGIALVEGIALVLLARRKK
jgi:hypothetical protein